MQEKVFTHAELEKIHVEIAKLMAETRKLNNEATKFSREAFWYPMLAASGLVTAVATLTGLAIKFLV